MYCCEIVNPKSLLSSLTTGKPRVVHIVAKLRNQKSPFIPHHGETHGCIVAKFRNQKVTLHPSPPGNLRLYCCKIVKPKGSLFIPHHGETHARAVVLYCCEIAKPKGLLPSLTTGKHTVVLLQLVKPESLLSSLATGTPHGCIVAKLCETKSLLSSLTTGKLTVVMLRICENKKNTFHP
jgi:hypothetical protein